MAKPGGEPFSRKQELFVILLLLLGTLLALGAIYYLDRPHVSIPSTSQRSNH